MEIKKKQAKCILSKFMDNTKRMLDIRFTQERLQITEQKGYAKNTFLFSRKRVQRRSYLTCHIDTVTRARQREKSR